MGTNHLVFWDLNLRLMVPNSLHRLLGQTLGARFLLFIDELLAGPVSLVEKLLAMVIQ